MKSFISILIAIWFILILVLGAKGAFLRPPQTPPIPILLGATVPLAGFVLAYLASTAFRRFILSADLRLLTAIQAWRAGGLTFLTLWAHGLLPALFAAPAGLGDIAIGVTAPRITLALITRPGYSSTRDFTTWNLLGILDLVVALTTGALSSGLFPALTGKITTAPMTQLPLILIPAFLVPLFIMLHLTALLQSRHPTPPQ